MCEEPSYSLFDLGKLSVPANTLIKKISAGVGRLYEPTNIKRIAKADVTAAYIRARGEIECADLKKRAMRRSANEEIRNQANMEQITSQSLPLLEENSKPEAIEDDWLTHFFDKCRIVSDQDMQSLWSKVLAGEANAPGSYSKRTLKFISELDKSEAEQFSKLCGYGLLIDEGITIIVLDYSHEIYQKNNIDFELLMHLQSIGLITFSANQHFVLNNIRKKIINVNYFGHTFELNMPKESDNTLPIGKVTLTNIGEELAPISSSKPVDGFKEYIMEYWKKFLNKEENAALLTDLNAPALAVRHQNI